ncbi:unnamed protein product [Moneuplotes crassus]|uniref:Palmitoyltransferase n=1 Tax=Euplotes crassus TaxID=5936 RepID=A0AAD1XA55_EUPCR|nr:unnamed protein product [Moneuplotes crassus]
MLCSRLQRILKILPSHQLCGILNKGMGMKKLQWKNGRKRNQSQSENNCGWKFLFTLIFIALEIILVCAILVPYLVIDFSWIASSLLVFIILVCYILIIIFYLMCVFIDTEQRDPGLPNSVSPDKQKDIKCCKLCKIQINPGTVHCFHCHKCVENFDHHCAWINQCIAKANHKYYIALLFVCIISSVLTISLVITFLANFENSAFKEEVFNIDGNFYIFATIWVAYLCFKTFSTASVMFLAMFHLWLLKKGTTTYHFLKSRRNAKVDQMNECVKPSISEPKFCRNNATLQAHAQDSSSRELSCEINENREPDKRCETSRDSLVASKSHNMANDHGLSFISSQFISKKNTFKPAVMSVSNGTLQTLAPITQVSETLGSAKKLPRLKTQLKRKPQPAKDDHL